MNSYKEPSLTRLTGLHCTITPDNVKIQSCAFRTDKNTSFYVLLINNDGEVFYLVSHRSLYESVKSMNQRQKPYLDYDHLSKANSLCTEVYFHDLRQCIGFIAHESSFADHPAIIAAACLCTVIACSIDYLTAEEMTAVDRYIPFFQPLISCHPSWNEALSPLRKRMTQAAKEAACPDEKQDALSSKEDVLLDLVPSCYLGIRSRDQSGSQSNQTKGLTEMKAKTPSGMLYFALLSQRRGKKQIFTVSTESVLPAMAVLSDSDEGSSDFYLDKPIYTILPIVELRAYSRHFSGKWKRCYQKTSRFATSMARELRNSGKDRLFCLNFQ